MSENEHLVQRMLTNPSYAVNVADVLCTPHPPLVSKEEWVAANAQLLQELGAEAWLHTLLDVLETGG